VAIDLTHLLLNWADMVSRLADITAVIGALITRLPRHYVVPSSTTAGLPPTYGLSAA